MKTIKHKLCALAFLSLAATTVTVQAQWNQNSTIGPFNYTDTANWNGGTINNIFATNLTTGLTIQFPANYTLTSQALLGWSNNAVVTFQSASSTTQTIKFSGTGSGGLAVTNAAGGTIIISTNTNPLILDLNGTTNCSIGGVAGTSGSANIFMIVNAQIIDSVGGNNPLKFAGDRVFTQLLNTNNSFVGPISFIGTRGGTFANIKPIGGGPSALGAPTDSTNGTITVADASSNGSLRYSGAGDTSDRSFVFNVTFSNALANAYALANAGTGLLKLTGQMSFPTNGTNNSQFIFSATNAPLELDGYIHGSGNTNGTYTLLCFAGGPGNTSTNRIILTGLSNDFRDFVVSNAVLAYNSAGGAGVPCALGAGTNVILGGGSQGFGGWLGNSGQGSSLQYNGTTNITFTRNIVLNGAGFYWALDNAATSTAMTWSNTITWNGPGASTISESPRYLYINPVPTSTNVVQSYIPDAGLVYLGTPVGVTLGIGNPYGITVANGGVVQLLNPTNSFAGGVQVGYARILQAMTLADVGQPSSIGTGASGSYEAVNGAAMQLTGINLGSPDSSRGGFLSYIGTNITSTSQHVTIFGPTFNSATIEICGLRNDSPNNSSVHFSDASAWTLQPEGTASGTNAYEALLSGTAKTTNTFDALIGDMPNMNLTVSPNSGNFAVTGSAWRETASQTYTGTTTVGTGTLLVNGSIAAGAGTTVNSGGVLAGTGTINENVNVLTNGTLAAGDGAIGTLTINGNVTNSGTILMKVSVTGATNDQLVLGVNTLNYGSGILSVSNLAGSYAIGNSFTLFSAGTISGSFSSITPAVPAAGLAWDTSQLSAGILKVMQGSSPTHPKITSVLKSDSGIVIMGTNGVANHAYNVLTSSNLLVPLTNWMTLTNGSFDGGGNFSITNTLGGPQEFYIIQYAFP